MNNLRKFYLNSPLYIKNPGKVLYLAKAFQITCPVNTYINVAETFHHHSTEVVDGVVREVEPSAANEFDRHVLVQNVDYEIVERAETLEIYFQRDVQIVKLHLMV